MDLPPTGSNKLLEIHTESVIFVIKRKSFVRPFVAQQCDSSLEISGSNIRSVKICEVEKIDSGFFAASSHRFSVEPLFFEQSDYEIIAESTSKERITVWHEDASIRKRIDSVKDGGDLVSGIVNFGSEIGQSDFEVRVGGKAVLIVRIEVFPSKVSYKNDYRNMLSDIANEIYSLSFDFLKKAFQQMTPGGNHAPTPAAFYKILEAIYTRFVSAAKKIIDTPYHKLVTEHVILPTHRIRKTDHSTEKWITGHPEYVLKTPNGNFRVSKALAVQKYVTYDTLENRFAKYILKSVVQRLKDFKDKYSQQKKTDNRDPDFITNYSEIMQCADNMVRGVNRLLSQPFFRKIGDYQDTHSMSLVFEMAPGYRELYKYYLMLKRGLIINSDIFKLSMKDTATLYEYWCFIKLFGILKRKYQLKSSDIIRVDQTGITVTLVKGKKSEVSFTNPATNECFTLTYNPGYQETQTVNQKPDNILSLDKSSSEIKYKYVFDAKYRIEANPDPQHYPDTNPGPKLDDINTMHRYRDSIVYENARNQRFMFEKAMFGAYVLFPYTDEEKYKSHRFYKSIDSVNIGGLPFLPGASSLVECFLSELINDSAESAFERTSLPAGIEKKLTTVDWTVRDVLVGPTETEKQYCHYLDRKCYYIPANYISDDVLPIHYVALAPTNQCREPFIHYYGIVIRSSIVNEMPADLIEDENIIINKYYHFEVKEWLPLNHSIPYRNQLIRQPMHTNLFLLEHARESYELFNIHNEEEYRLMEELKRFFAHDIPIELRNNDVLFKVNEEISVWSHAECLDIITAEGVILKTFSIKEFRRSPRSFLIHLHSIIETDN